MFLKLKLLFLLALTMIEMGFAVSSETWDSYKRKYNKTYVTEKAEKDARENYDKSYFSIMIHNSAYEQGLISYKLSVNQFSDMSFDHVRSMFPQTKLRLKNCNNTADFNLIKSFPEVALYTQNVYHSEIEDQGLKCNSGWAYAAATALAIFRARSSFMEVRDVSAQHLIDCVGQTNSCKNQTSLKAFSYLTKTNQIIYDKVDYPNTPWSGMGECVLPRNSSYYTYSLHSFYSLCEVDLSLLTNVIQNIAPVIIDFNPLSFEFFHYSEGIFTPPNHSLLGSHYMTVIGYGKDSTGSKYWNIQNSFGKIWGENGYIRLYHDSLQTVTKRALFPTKLVQK